ncbi:uncharacterized protein LOC132545848 [Ylistrum balloti]|uniref:uncharacterized protein LOC132545848 n=1 Tax=Ylistrum balloti TaxID=509963 RepID=UPI002905E6C7|nr:uncharacterized protein LOC132545848 [Ylistrum balloti]
MMLLVYLSVLVSGCQSTKSVDKRILLNDPQYVQQEFTRFQSELQELQVTLNTQHQENVNLKNTMTSLNKTVAELQFTIRTQNMTSIQNTVSEVGTNKGAAVFNRWGRKDCPANITSLVYTGYAGGSMFTSPGAAAEYLCMPSDPIWGPHKDLSYSNEWVGYVYGAEYEGVGTTLFGMGDGTHDVPCAVCLGSQYTVSLMIPGRTECYPGWTKAYHGDLSSGSHNVAAATQYVCVDQHPQYLEGGADKNENGKLFYGVKSKCGPLHCPPYEDNKLLSCVVCLK